MRYPVVVALVKSSDLETFFSFEWAWSQGLIPSRNGKQGYPPPNLFVFLLIWLCKNVVKWDGSGRGRLRPVQNDRTGCPDVLGVVLAQNSYKKRLKNQQIRNFRGGLRGRRRRGRGGGRFRRLFGVLCWGHCITTNASCVTRFRSCCTSLESCDTSIDSCATRIYFLSGK